MLFKTISYLLILLIVVVTAAVIFRAFQFQMEGFSASVEQASGGYKGQLALVQKLQESRFNGRRDFNDMLLATKMPPAQQCFVNFHVLGCRYPSYLGPFKGGYFDTDNAVLASLKMGCRCLILDIDYYERVCDIPFPRLVVRDSIGANMAEVTSDIQCQNLAQSNIYDTASSIAKYAFSNSVPNPVDPLIIVLNILRVPTGDGTSDPKKIQQKYYSNIAKALAPLRANAVNILATGGNYSRQAQEGALLSNPISTYSGQVLFFCNADTSLFRSLKKIPIEEDLDFLINLRLTYTQTQFGVTQNTSSNSSGMKFALLESVESYMQIPDEKVAGIQSTTNNTWTLCLNSDPSKITPKASYDYQMKKIGVHCIPIDLWSTGADSYDYMFDKDHFGKWSFLPKREGLRYTIPATNVPPVPSKAIDANGGNLKPPVVPGTGEDAKESS
jgi:hypothetical protein